MLFFLSFSFLGDFPFRLLVFVWCFFSDSVHHQDKMKAQEVTLRGSLPDCVAARCIYNLPWGDAYLHNCSTVVSWMKFLLWFFKETKLPLNRSRFGGFRSFRCFLLVGSTHVCFFFFWFKAFLGNFHDFPPWFSWRFSWATGSQNWLKLRSRVLEDCSPRACQVEVSDNRWRCRHSKRNV